LASQVITKKAVAVRRPFEPTKVRAQLEKARELYDEVEELSSRASSQPADIQRRLYNLRTGMRGIIRDLKTTRDYCDGYGPLQYAFGFLRLKRDFADLLVTQRLIRNMTDDLIAKVDAEDYRAKSGWELAVTFDSEPAAVDLAVNSEVDEKEFVLADHPRIPPRSE